MATSGQRFSGFPAVFGYNDGVSKTLDVQDMMGYDLQANNQFALRRPAGALDPAAYLLARNTALFNLRTPQLDTVMTQVGIASGFCFNEPSTFYFQERADCGAGFLTGQTHPGRRTQHAFMYVDSINASQDDQQGAVLSLILVPLKVSGSPLIENVTDADLQAGGIPAPAYVSSYFLGPTLHNSVAIPGVMSVSINPQITFNAAPSNPGAFSEIGSITVRQTELRIRYLKLDEFDAIPVTSSPVNTEFACYFQKADPINANGDGRVAANVAEHVKIAGTGGVVETRSITVDGNDDAATEVVVMLTGVPTVSVASAIPAGTQPLMMGGPPPAAPEPE